MGKDGKINHIGASRNALQMTKPAIKSAASTLNGEELRNVLAKVNGTKAKG